MRLLFVCLGNICRSPMAEGVVRSQAQGLGWQIDSAGTGDWHVGAAPDSRAMAECARHGIDISGQRARQVSREDFGRFDLILAMDRSNLADLKRLDPAKGGAELGLLLDYAPERGWPRDVPDPYHSGGFGHVFQLIEAAGRVLVARRGAAAQEQ